MASKIVPGNIDGTFPKAGQDNSSQGFRDNFSAINTNFTEAKSEIEDLQTNKASKDGASNFADNEVSRAKFKDTSETVASATKSKYNKISGTLNSNFFNSLFNATTNRKVTPAAHKNFSSDFSSTRFGLTNASAFVFLSPP